MKIKEQFFVTAFILGLGLATPGWATPQIFRNLHNFSVSATNGNVPGAVIIASNLLFGTTYFGGSSSNGVVFRMNTDGTGYTNLHEFTAVSSSTGSFTFTNSDGANPGGFFLNGALVFSGGALYGNTYQGGKFAQGTVFKVNADGTGFTNLHDFAGDSGGASAGLVLSGNTLYGAAGSVFKLTTNGTDFITLHHFTPTTGDNYTNSDGSEPAGGLLLSGDVLYGTALLGGTAGLGTVFAVNTDGTGFTNLHNFDFRFDSLSNHNDGFNPAGALILSGNTLYGTASGGIWTNGMIFAINTNGSGFTNLYSFGPNSGPPSYGDATGSNPNGGLILSGSTLYGTAYGGGLFGNGTVFAVDTDGSRFVDLYDFSAAFGLVNSMTNGDGIGPSGGLALLGNTLYGTANVGGLQGRGTVFSLTLPSPPQLTIRLSVASIVLSWPTNHTGFTLEANTNLTTNVWSVVSPAPAITGTNNVVTNAISGPARFYRLRH